MQNGNLKLKTIFLLISFIGIFGLVKSSLAAPTNLAVMQ